MEILIKSELKHLIDIHDLLNNVQNIEDVQSYKNITLDLTNLSFVSPIGAIALLQFFEEIIKLDNYHIILPEDKENLVTYIERMNFFDYCPEPITKVFKEKYDIDKMGQRVRNDQRKVLLEITKIQEYDDIDVLYDSVVYILKSHGMKSGNITRVANIFTELGTNILDHSGGTGYAAIQYYPKFDKIMIGIADTGKGMIKEIRKEDNEIESDLEIINKAFSGGFSSSKDIDRGWGLVDARDYSHEGTKHTSFELRTHKGLYRVGKNDIELINEKKYHPGTFYLIELQF
ncbi:hypothetical protein ACFTQ7_20655 [Lysinibacillus sp. NPDC056959]|uniref:hypothetical protein n=1 Tax=Lysinibacillus sp. NPDC056959 TaxID=3345981 RepID=UPI0036311B71